MEQADLEGYSNESAESIKEVKKPGQVQALNFSKATTLTIDRPDVFADANNKDENAKNDQLKIDADNKIIEAENDDASPINSKFSSRDNDKSEDNKDLEFDDNQKEPRRKTKPTINIGGTDAFNDDSAKQEMEDNSKQFATYKEHLEKTEIEKEKNQGDSEHEKMTNGITKEVDDNHPQPDSSKGIIH